jgi:hypothetical protein
MTTLGSRLSTSSETFLGSCQGAASLAKTVDHPSFKVTVNAGGIITIQQTDGVPGDRSAVSVHPDDLAKLIEELEEAGGNAATE